MLNTNHSKMPKKITYRKMFKMLGAIQNVYIQNQHSATIEFEGGWAMYDYGTLIAVETLMVMEGYPTKMFYTIYHDFSRTTMRELKKFDARNAKERRNGLKEGRYTLIINKESAK